MSYRAEEGRFFIKRKDGGYQRKLVEADRNHNGFGETEAAGAILSWETTDTVLGVEERIQLIA